MSQQIKAAGNTDIDIQGHQNVVITGDFQGNITVTIGGRDMHAEELACLDGLIGSRRREVGCLQVTRQSDAARPYLRYAALLRAALDLR